MLYGRRELMRPMCVAARLTCYPASAAAPGMHPDPKINGLWHRQPLAPDPFVGRPNRSTTNPLASARPPPQHRAAPYSS